ncbi:DUF1642 domain-containing protein [Lactococcus lactis]|uniref:DUF1642 domain-containing protein n=1 Tax=Lactococcus lactis TaxID=1358 RepID=UPI0018AA95FF|nr:DUF1642 domain-containing protein [Lactococcus lactis]
MTKFEEEFNYLIELSGKVLIGQVDAETFEKNRIAFFEKYETDQQQALPVVPECVAEYIERCKRSDCGLIWAIRPDRDANDNSEKVYDWLFPNGVKLPNGMYPNPYEPDNLVRPDKENQIKFVRAWLDGYQVEKPQLFYLKHIDMSKKYNSQAQVIAFGHDDGIIDGHAVVPAETFPIDSKYKFTQQEINSMQTGSYEQIEVTE